MAKTAIITGGSRGLGAAMTMKLGEMGYNVVLNYRQESSKKLCDDIMAQLKSKYNVDSIAVQVDVATYEGCEKLVNAAVAKFGDNIDVLVNNAGVTNNCDFLKIKKEDYERLINVNLMSQLHMCRLVLPHMVNHSSKENQCNIVNLASVGGLMGVINQADYCASKAGVIGLTRALSLEFASRGVRVNAIAPGLIMTDMVRGVNQDELAALAATIPEGFIGEPEEIAVTLEYILKCSYLTMQIISPNGGLVMGR